MLRSSRFISTGLNLIWQPSTSYRYSQQRAAKERMSRWSYWHKSRGPFPGSLWNSVWPGLSEEDASHSWKWKLPRHCGNTSLETSKSEKSRTFKVVDLSLSFARFRMHIVFLTETESACSFWWFILICFCLFSWKKKWQWWSFNRMYFIGIAIWL